MFALNVSGFNYPVLQAAQMCKHKIPEVPQVTQAVNDNFDS